MTQRLQKGESISINTLNDLVIATEWQNKTTIPSLEMDVSAFLLTDNKVSSDADFIFYNQPSSLNNAVLLKNRRFKINLKQLAPDINRIAFVLSELQEVSVYFSLPITEYTDSKYNVIHHDLLLST